MRISLKGVGKRYARNWIFRGLTTDFETTESCAVLGNNGSGKSTLLRIVAGMQSPSEGNVGFHPDDQTPLGADDVFKTIAYCAPGMELPEEMTLREALQFHFVFKEPLSTYTVDSIVRETGLQRFADMPVADYSSGMKQRVKLAQAIFSATPVLMLDEPCTNLDDDGVAQYLNWMSRFTAGRLVIVASNDAREYAFCNRRLELRDYQP